MYDEDQVRAFARFPALEPLLARVKRERRKRELEEEDVLPHAWYEWNADYVQWYAETAQEETLRFMLQSRLFLLRQSQVTRHALFCFPKNTVLRPDVTSAIIRAAHQFEARDIHALAEILDERAAYIVPFLWPIYEALRSADLPELPVDLVLYCESQPDCSTFVLGGQISGGSRAIVHPRHVRGLFLGHGRAFVLLPPGLQYVLVMDTPRPTYEARR